MKQSAPDSRSTSRWKRIAMSSFRFAILAIVFWGIWRTVESSRSKFADPWHLLNEIRYGWLVLAAFLYVVGTVPAAIFWWRSLQLMGQPVGFVKTVRAYFCGGLGKYAPGKAMVVIARSNMLSGPGVDWRVVVLSVFVETLTVMAVGALVGAGLIAFLFPQHRQFLAGALGLTVVVGIPSLPPVFRPIVRWIAKRKGAATESDLVERLDVRFLAASWGGLAFGWIVTGLSLWAVVQGVPHEVAQEMSFTREISLATACACLAVVFGFVTLLPAGVGAREYAMVQLLGPVYGNVSALVISAIARLTWLVAEFIVSTILYMAVNRAAPIDNEQAMD